MAEPSISSGSSSSPIGARMTDLPRKVASATRTSRTTTGAMSPGLLDSSPIGSMRMMVHPAVTMPSATIIILVDDLKT